VTSRPFVVLSACLLVLAVSMAFYVWQLRNRSEWESAFAPVAQMLPPPHNGAPSDVTLWIAHDGTGVLTPQKNSVALSTDRQRKAEEMLRSLLLMYTGKNSPHHLPPAADVRNVYFVDPGLVVIDMNSELVNGQTSGILSEELTIASLAQTLSANFQGISRIKFLVNGKESDTLAGHADLSRVYSTSQISDLVKQLSVP
jgi:hypothetical protein